MVNPFDFSGKKIVVTGATSGIGRATSIALSRQGAVVHLIGRSEEALKGVLRELSGEENAFHLADFAKENDYNSIFEDIIRDGKKIDGMVHSVGIAKVIPLTMLNYSNMDESMRVNFYSMVELVKVLAKKKYHNNASVVTVSSIAAQYPGKCQGIYAATKASINVMTQTLAMELSQKGIRINSVMPASVNTRMMLQTNDNRDESLFEKEKQKQLLGIEEPEDIADIILFLLSDASKKITGRSIYADAGYINF